MNRNPRIKLEDSPIEMMIKLAEGNPGAITVLANLFREEKDIDPDAALAPFHTILALDDMGIYGSNIWILFKDVCGQSTLNMVGLFRASQLGFLRREQLVACITDPAQRPDIPALLSKVRERLPAFGQPKLEA